jgi:hypothetical protein
MLYAVVIVHFVEGDSNHLNCIVLTGYAVAVYFTDAKQCALQVCDP